MSNTQIITTLCAITFLELTILGNPALAAQTRSTKKYIAMEPRTINESRIKADLPQPKTRDDDNRLVTKPKPDAILAKTHLPESKRNPHPERKPYPKKWTHHQPHIVQYNYPHFYPRRYPLGRLAVSLPYGYIEISFSGTRYYFHGGYFYRRNPYGYIVVPAPVNVIVTSIPSGNHCIVIDGITYYTYDGVYYQRVAGGYQVVAPPKTVLIEPVTLAETFSEDQSLDSLTINIPNNEGKFTAVEIKRSGTGFTGPQGEFYPEFPSVEQLRIIYVK